METTRTARWAGLVLLAATSTSTGCATVALQTDDFREASLARGCASEAACQTLVTRARERHTGCKENTIGYLRCRDTRADLSSTTAMLQVHVDERRKHEAAEKRQAIVEAHEARVAAQRQAASDRRARREASRLAREDERLRREQEGLEEERRMQHDPDYAVPKLSASLCRSHRDLEDAQAQLREDKRIDRLSGTIRPGQRRDDVEYIESLKADVRRYRLAIRKHRRSALPCAQN